MLSVSADGTHASNVGVGERFCVSADGRYAAFTSTSTNLVSPDANGLADVFVRDCKLGAYVWSTVHTLSSGGVSGTFPLDFTPDGRFLLFASNATNLVAGATNTITQLYRQDLWSNQTVLVSVSYDAVNASAGAINMSFDSRQPWISSDGRFVLFLSTGTDLVTGVDSNATQDAYCRDLQSGTTELITASPSGQALERWTYRCFMSSNGRYFAFETRATNVVAGMTNTGGRSQVYWRDRLAGTNVLVSADTDGNFASESATLNSLSRDGRYVCFSCLSTDIVAGQNDFNGTQDLFIRDMLAGQTLLVTHATNGNTTASRVSGGEFSANGEWMLVAPTIADLVPGVQDVNGSNPDLYLHHIPTRTNVLVTRSVSGLTGASDYASDGFARVSGSGHYVVFSTYATNLLSGGTNKTQRLLLRDVAASRTFDPVPGSFVTPAYNYGHFVFTEDDAYVYFLASGKYDPSVTDYNNAPDLFRARLRAAKMELPAPGDAIHGTGIALGTYILQSSTNLVNWINAATNTADSNGVFTVSDPVSLGEQRYYRLVTP